MLIKVIKINHYFDRAINLLTTKFFVINYNKKMTIFQFIERTRNGNRY